MVVDSNLDHFLISEILYEGVILVLKESGRVLGESSGSAYIH